MVYRVPKGNLPQQEFTPSKYKDEEVMITTVPTGVIVIFLEMGETRYMTYDEIIEYMALAPVLEMPKEPEPEEKRIPVKDEKKPGIREVRPSKPN